MPLGKKSKEKLATCHPELQRLFEDVAAGVDRGECPGVKDITVLCGHRGQAEQDKAYADGSSKKQWPGSKHNALPSLATDAAPYPIDWDDLQSFRNLRGYVLDRAEALGIKIRVISWDWPHYELRG